MPGTREIGALVVEMRADATKFVRGMDRSERAMKDTRRESGRLGKSLGGIRAGATRAVGIISGLATVATRRDNCGNESIRRTCAGHSQYIRIPRCQHQQRAGPREGVRATRPRAG